MRRRLDVDAFEALAGCGRPVQVVEERRGLLQDALLVENEPVGLVLPGFGKDPWGVGLQRRADADATGVEWHPEARSGKRVTVSNLGLRYFYARGENPRLLNPVENENIPNLPTARIQAHAFVNAPTLSFGEQQKLYVIVQNQNLQAVSGAQVQVRVVFPNRNEQTYQASTSVDGVSTFDILIGENTIGLVNIFVDVTHNALKANTRTSFQLWY